MKSRTSFFNATIFKRHLSRSWPLWGVAALFFLIHYGSLRYSTQDAFTEHMLESAVDLSQLWFAYSLVAAFICFGYLHKRRRADMMHALPVTRGCLYVTGLASGLLLFLIPMVSGLLAALLSGLRMGTLSFGGLGLNLAIGFAEYLIFFGLAVLCMHITGKTVGAVMLYFLLNFIAPITEELLRRFMEPAMYGLELSKSWGLKAAAPLIRLLGIIQYPIYDIDLRLKIDWPYLAVLAVAGLACMGIAWLLYRQRRVETAGELIAQKPLRPVFRTVLAVEAALLFGLIFCDIVLGDYQASLAADRDLPVLIGFLILGGAIGFFGAEMLLQKTLRVFKAGVLIRFAVFAMVLSATLLGLCHNVFGLVRGIPAAEQVEYVVVSNGKDNCLIRGQEDMEQLLHAHEQIASDCPFAWHASPTKLEYHLKDGTVRSYCYPLPSTDESSLAVTELVTQPSLQLALIEHYFENGFAVRAQIDTCSFLLLMDLTEAQTETMLNLLRQEVAEGITLNRFGSIKLEVQDSRSNGVYLFDVPSSARQTIKYILTIFDGSYKPNDDFFYILGSSE